MAPSRGKALLLSLLTGALAAGGAAVLLALVYAVTGLWLAGHGRVLWGWDGTRVAGFNWPEAAFEVLTFLCGLGVAALAYRAWRPPRSSRHDS